MSVPLRVLIVEDNSDDMELLLAELRRAGYAPEWVRVETEEAFLLELAKAPDIVLSDYSMPRFSGLRAAELLRLSGQTLPFILISGTVGEEVAVEAMRQGATDYLLKDRMGRLGSAVERALRDAQVNRERLEARAAIARVQQHLQNALEYSPLVVYSLKVEGDRVMSQLIHENITRLTGFSVQESSTYAWWIEHVHPEDRQRILDGVAATLKGTLHKAEYRLRHKAGHYLWLEDHRRVLRDPTGAPVELSGVWIDITARKSSELALERVHRDQALILDSIDQGIHGIDLDGNITFENVASARMFGWATNNPVGRSAHALTHHSYPDGSPFPDAACDIVATLSDGVSRRIDSQSFWRPDGSAFPVEYVVAPKLDQHGQVIGAVVVFDDIAERRSLEAQLRQSQKLESIGQLAGGIAHDFNNILGAVMLQADLASSVPDTPGEVLEGLSVIQSAAGRAADLTRQLLLFSRKQVMQPQVVNVSDAVTAIARMLSRLVPEHVELQLQLHPSALWTYADPGMLDQIVLNLAVNASDAMPDGGRLRIETSEQTLDAMQLERTRDALPGRFIALSVSDTGEGISPEIRSRIFEPFFTTKDAGKGTGLGLATVFGIVKQHRGWIEVQSEAGIGTTMRILLPAADTPAGNAVVDVNVQTISSHRSERILVAEDDEVLRGLTRTVLESHGYRVVTAANGVEAHEIWRTRDEDFALLLTDLVMPGDLDGRNLAELLQFERPMLKVLFTSGYSAAIAGRELHLAQGQWFVQKPWSTEQLLRAVGDCLA